MPIIKALPSNRRGASENTVIPKIMESTKATKEMMAYRFMGRSKLVNLFYKHYRLIETSLLSANKPPLS